MDDLYAALGIPKDASPEVIKKAYLMKSNKNHPDRGGDVKSFQLITLAGTVLLDPDKRSHYDKTGDTRDPKNDIATAIASLVAEAFAQDFVDPIRWMCDQLDHTRSEYRKNKSKFEQVLKKAEIKRKKFTEANKATKNVVARDFILTVLGQKLDELRAAIVNCDRQIEFGDAALAYLNELKYPQENNGRNYTTKSAVVFSSWVG